ncbi:hypothetical protein QJQ12_04910 [Chlamydia suis]|nr:hypothetical protein [Chlamydia suis]MEB2816285.1 hypothetical protein [Chlamydia suis]
MDATTGEISGSAKATSNQTTYTVNVTDANLSSRSPMTLALTVANAPTVTEVESNKVAVIGSYVQLHSTESNFCSNWENGYFHERCSSPSFWSVLEVL